MNIKSAEANKDALLINVTESVCPVCLKVIPAQIITEAKTVYMTKSCHEHGSFKTYVWPDRDHYNWVNDFKLPLIPPDKIVESRKGCPEDCGVCHSHLRRSTLVEIELTERCNLRCPVCFMSAEEVQVSAQSGPSLSELENEFNTILEKTGPNTSIQLTGGEPTIRKDLPEIIALGRRIGFSAIEVNTNGVVIAKNPAYLRKLVSAGISGIYMQFDGMTNQVYKTIRGENLLETKLAAVRHCREAGIQVVLAMTIISGVNETQLGDVLRFALENRDVIAGVAYQPAFGSGRFEVSNEERLTMGDVAFMLAEQSYGLIKPYDLWPLGCSHPLCSSATYIVEEGDGLIPITRRITPEEYINCFDPASPQGSVFPDLAENLFPDMEPGLSVVVMNYMDAMSMDLNRLKECSMMVSGHDGRIIPFCSYQLTDIKGKKRTNTKSGMPCTAP